MCLTILVLASLSLPAYADDCGLEYPNDENWSSFKVRAVNQTKVHFLDESGKSTNAFLVKGDEVLLANDKTIGGLTCVTFINYNGKFTAGALLLPALSELTTKSPPAEMILGKWESIGSQWISAGNQVDKEAMALINGAVLEIGPSTINGKVRLRGDAAASSSVEQAEESGPNVGILATDVGDDGKPLDVNFDGTTITFTHNTDSTVPITGPLVAGKDGFDCVVRFKLLGSKYVIGQDNLNCGGHNVSFTGLYFKKN